MGDSFNHGRWTVVEAGPGNGWHQLVTFRDSVMGIDREATIRRAEGSHLGDDPVIHFHDDCTLLVSRDGQASIVRFDRPEIGLGRTIATGSNEAMEAAWRLLLPTAPVAYRSNQHSG